MSVFQDVVRGVALHVVREAGTSALLWSPCGRWLYAASTGPSFRVWDTRNWTAQRWALPSGCVSAAAWSPDGLTLLVALADSPRLFALHVRLPTHRPRHMLSHQRTGDN